MVIDFDRKLTDLETARVLAGKIPVTSGWGCGFGGAFMAAFSQSPLVGLDHCSLMPDDLELRQLRSFAECYVRGYYNPEWTRKLLDAPFVVDEGLNTYLFLKGDRGWIYRRKTWDYGWAPHGDDGMPSLVHILTLAECFCSEPSDRWLKWVADHAELFDPVIVDHAVGHVRAYFKEKSE